MSSGADPREELAALARGLASHARRRAALGERGVPRRELAMAPAHPTGASSIKDAPSTAPEPERVLAAQPRRGPVETESAVAVRSDEAGAGVPTAAVAAACDDLESLRAAVAACRACALCEGRTQTVFSDGTGSAGVMFVGEAPGQREDEQGVPFVGPAGQLLTDIIVKGMGLRREEVLIANVLKCRPPGNRDPETGETELCTPFLDRQIALHDPRILIALGRHAAHHLLRTDRTMRQLRGRTHRRDGRPVVVTYHPAYLLRTPSAKRDCWQDIQLAMAEIGLPRPDRAR